MKTQILIIHGGDTFETYEAYLDFLKDFELDFGRAQTKGWKETLGERLGEAYEVFRPSMPCKWNAKYLEWKIWFEKYVPHLRDGVVLVGHSLGGIFLAKYLSENKLSITVAATLLVAPPFDAVDSEYTLGDFILPTDMSLFTNQGGAITIFFSEDDDIVPFVDLEKYKKALPDTATMVFKDRGHFIGEEFPELVHEISLLR